MMAQAVVCHQTKVTTMTMAVLVRIPVAPLVLVGQVSRPMAVHAPAGHTLIDRAAAATWGTEAVRTTQALTTGRPC